MATKKTHKKQAVRTQKKWQVCDSGHGPEALLARWGPRRGVQQAMADLCRFTEEYVVVVTLWASLLLYFIHGYYNSRHTISAQGCLYTMVTL